MSTVFRAATYNIQHGAIADFDWAALMQPVKSVRAALVGVQEVDMHTKRSHGLDSTEGIRLALGWPEGRFIPSMPYSGGLYGNAVFSALPLEAFEVAALVNRPGQEPRSCGHAVLRMDNGKRLHFLTAHLAYENAASRKPQFEQLRAILDAIPGDEAFILTGDFNTEREEEFLPLFNGRAALANTLSEERSASDPHYRTFPGTGHAIDNLVYDVRNLKMTAVGMKLDCLSDHNMLWAEFAYRD